MEFKTRKELDDEDWERYRKKQDDIHARIRAKHEREGWKCTLEVCNKYYKDYNEWQDHIIKHQEELKKAMICNQPKCGKKFNNRRAYNEHCEEHKKDIKARIVNSIRAVLMYNKHGLLLEVFEQEYRGMVGKPIPHKFFGFNCIYDLLVAWPEVVEVTQLGGGQVLLIGVPDKKTEHIAKMVGNQRDNREGFNRRTGQMLSRVGMDVINKIEKVSGRKTREVPEFMKKQVEQLVEMEAFEEGLFLTEFSQVYEQEFGYPLDFRSYGFFSLQDFCYNGLQGSVGLDLTGDGWWKIHSIDNVPSSRGVGEQAPIVDIPEDVKNNFKTLLRQNPFGLSSTSFLRNYENYFGNLNLRQLRCSNLYEMILLLPDCCTAARDAGGQVTVLPPCVEGEWVDTDIPLNIQILGEVKNNIHQLLQSHPGGVRLENFVKGYEGYYGCIPLAVLRCKTNLDLLRSLGDVCEVVQGDSGHLVVPVIGAHGVSDDLRIQGKDILPSVIKVLEKYKDGIKIERLPEIFLKHYGENFPTKLCSPTLVSMLKCFPDKVEVVNDKKDYVVKLRCLKEDATISRHSIRTRIASGWVKVLQMSDNNIMTLQLTEELDKMKEMESTMETFYTSQVEEEIITPDLFKGMEVAALYSDLLWHRGIVVEFKRRTKMVVVEYVDWGWRGEVSVNAVRKLDKRFCSLPYQTVNVRCKGLDAIISSWEEVIKQGNMKGRVVADDTGPVYMDLYTNHPRVNNEKVQMVKPSSKSLQPAKLSGCYLDQELATRKLILGSLARLREKERGVSIIGN